MHSRGLRFVAIDNYIVFYLPDAEEQVVTILRVMYSGRNIEEQVKRPYKAIKQFHIPHKAVTPLEINRFFYTYI